jgi:Trk K+ transport system NAD-binding subunit
VLVSVIRKGKIFIPEAETMLEPGDEVLAVVHASQRDELKAHLGPVKLT